MNYWGFCTLWFPYVMFFAKELGGGQNCEKQESRAACAEKENQQSIFCNVLGKLECDQSKKKNLKCPC